MFNLIGKFTTASYSPWGILDHIGYQTFCADKFRGFGKTSRIEYWLLMTKN
jgi:hypothetical protein